jgi:hypothetical protein
MIDTNQVHCEPDMQAVQSPRRGTHHSILHKCLHVLVNCERQACHIRIHPAW